MLRPIVRQHYDISKNEMRKDTKIMKEVKTEKNKKKKDVYVLYQAKVNAI